MTEENTTLAEILQMDLRNVEDSPNTKALMEHLMNKVHVPPPVWNKQVEGKVIEKLLPTLEVNPSKLWLAAWTKYKEFLPYLDASKYPPDKEFPVALATHRITYSHRLTIIVQIAGVSGCRVDVDFELSAEMLLQGAILKIKGGKIMSIEAGNYEADLALRLDGELLFQLPAKSEQHSLPMSITLGDGVPILPV